MMTIKNKEYLNEKIDKIEISTDGMNLAETKAYIKGFDDAKNAILDILDNAVNQN